jgi:hypothetical protein
LFGVDRARIQLLSYGDCPSFEDDCFPVATTTLPASSSSGSSRGPKSAISNSLKVVNGRQDSLTNTKRSTGGGGGTASSSTEASGPDVASCVLVRDGVERYRR